MPADLTFCTPRRRLLARAGLVSLISAASLLSGCAVIAVVDTAASLAIGTVGLVGEAAIGTVRIAGKVVGATADAVLPSPPQPAKP